MPRVFKDGHAFFGFGGKASDAVYDNTNSGLNATNVQSAIDENASNISALNSRINANKRGTPVDLSPYNSSTNRYTFPSDGYIFVSGEGRTNGQIQIPVYGANSGDMIAGLYMNITSTYQIDSLYVRKGMKCFIQYKSVNTIAEFQPLVN